MPLLVLMVALILLMGSFFKVADLVQYVSRAVIIGYIAGAALLIIANQLNYVFGIDSEKEARSFFTILYSLFDRLDEANFASVLLGIGTIIGYFVYLDANTTHVRPYWTRAGQQGTPVEGGDLRNSNQTFWEGNVTYYTNS